MKYLPAGIAVGLSFLVLAVVARAHDDHDFKNWTDGPSRTFSVPIDIGSSGLTPTSLVKGKLTLKKPAILESYSGFCAGQVNFGILGVDGGPRGANGTTLNPANTSSAFQLRPDVAPTDMVLDFNKDHVTASYPYALLAPTHVGIPIKSEIEVSLFPVTGQDIRCQMILVFRSID